MNEGRINNTKHKECDLGLKFAVHMNQNGAKRKFGKPFLCIDKTELSPTWIFVCETFQEHNWPIKYFRSTCFFILSNLSYLLYR